VSVAGFLAIVGPIRHMRGPIRPLCPSDTLQLCHPVLLVTRPFWPAALPSAKNEAATEAFPPWQVNLLLVASWKRRGKLAAED